MPFIPTPKPGQPLKAFEAKEVINQFFQNYRTTKRWEGKPTWLVLAPNSFIRVGKHVIGKNILEHPSLKNFQDLTIIFENTREVFKASWREIQDYLEKREPGESYDIYILNSEQTWCLIYTSEDECGYDVLLLAGDYQLFEEWLILK